MLNTKQRLARLEEILREEFELEPETEVSFVFRGDYDTHIAEIGFFTPDPEKGKPFGSGGGWMACEHDVKTLTLIFAAERFCIDHSEEWDGIEEDFCGYSEELLRFACSECRK